jgi:hypothetical protein
MKKCKQESSLDGLTKKRISKLEWKKGIKKVDERMSAFIVQVLDNEEKWIKETYNKLGAEERKLFNQFIEATLHSLAGHDYDRFLEKMEPLINESSKQNIEEARYVGIANSLDRLTKEKNRFPARCEIVSETGYSHKAVNECLEKYRESFIYKGREEELLVMREKMISMCYQYGINGDMKAARLFLESTTDKRDQTYNKNEQNNFIQINGYTITTEQLRLLPKEKQIQIQEILTLLNGPIK